MRRLIRRLRLVVVSLALVVGAQAHAASMSEYTTFLASTPLNGSANSRTFSIVNPTGTYATLRLEVKRTRAAGTDLTLTCISTNDPLQMSVAIGSLTDPGTRTTCAYDASGFCNSVTATYRSTTSVSETMLWSIDVLGYMRTDCTFASTAAGGSDFVQAKGRMVTL